MSRILCLVPLLAAAGVLACGQDSSTEPNPLAEAGPSLSASGPIERPAGGSCDTRFTFVGADVIAIELDCTLRHLGRTTGTATQTITITGPAPDGGLANTLSSSPVYVAADGDVLNASFSGTGIVNPVTGIATFSGTETYLGGTGRFAGATGSVTLVGTASLGAATGRYEVSGSIVF